MTEVATRFMHPQPHTRPRNIPHRSLKIEPRFQSSAAKDIRNDLAKLEIMSPVNQNGSYEFDRVIKSGMVLKRTRKTKTWKPIYLVLRPNLLSIYRDKDETGLRHQINPSELTAVARQKDPKRRAEYVFGLFSPSRNFHLAASSEKEAQEWVELIRHEARIDEEEEEMILMSPTTGTKNIYHGFDRGRQEDISRDLISSSSEGEIGPRPPSSMIPEKMHSARRPSHALSYSGNEHGSYSDFSDTGFWPHGSNVSLPRPSNADGMKNSARPDVSRTASPDHERIVCQGWLYILKSKGGVRQWKKLWVVLRPKTLAFYKSDDEYSANLILSFHSIIDAVEIDPVSRSKRHCMQIITEERNYRFCASDEDSLAKWLGALKCLLAKRKEAELQHAVATASTSNVITQAPPRQ